MTLIGWLRRLKDDRYDGAIILHFHKGEPKVGDLFSPARVKLDSVDKCADTRPVTTPSVQRLI